MNIDIDYAQVLAITFLVVVGIAVACGIVFATWMYITDKFYAAEAIRRNYPIIGRFRYLAINMGEFLRQYLYAMDREEMPFNRALRNYVYKTARNEASTQPFGSTRALTTPGDLVFTNALVPVLENDAKPTSEITIGKNVKTPYKTNSIFNISGMSYGAISPNAVLSLSGGAKMAGCWMNTGEGGLSPFHIKGGADIVFQIGTAKYGVRDADGNLCNDRLKELSDRDSVKMFEIKLSQGAKPGKGGILPGVKVSKEIAKIRGIPAGTDSISPNRHVEITSSDKLVDFINRIRDVVEKPVGIKMVIGNPDEFVALCETFNKRGIDSAPDFITIDSADGGTGAAPLSLIDYMGLRIFESLPIVAQTLKDANLKDRIKLFTSGKLVDPGSVAWALAMGADGVNSARGFMLSLGCIQAMQCHKNTCPAGITTHNKSLQRGLNPKTKTNRVAQYCKNLAHEVEILAHSCGVAEPRLLRPEHVRVITANQRTQPIQELVNIH